jgi:CRP-like cAMP-binding protein
MVDIKNLTDLSLFEGISAEKLAPLTSLCEEIHAAAGDVLFCEGCEAEKLYILLEGNVTLSMKLTSRPENLVLGIISKYGQCFGWSVIVSANYYTASAEAKEVSRILAIKGKDFKEFLKNDPEIGFTIAMRMVEIVSSRLRYYRVLLKTF